MKWFIAILILSIVLIAGCTQIHSIPVPTQYVCPDGSTVTDLKLCPSTITLEGRDFSEIDRIYTDLDLSVAKMFLVLFKNVTNNTVYINNTNSTFTLQNFTFRNITKLSFRANLTEAERIQVSNENSLISVLLNPKVYKVHVAYFPNETENPFYATASFELGNKLGILYRFLYENSSVELKYEDDGSTCLVFPNTTVNLKCFNSLPINSTDELNSTDVEPVILLLGPSHANKTAVTVS